MTSETWTNQIFTDPAFAAKVKVRWKRVYPTLTQSDSFVDTQSGLISTSAAANLAKWNISERLETEQMIKVSWSTEAATPG